MFCDYNIQAQQNFLAFMVAWGSDAELRLTAPPISMEREYPRLSKYIIKLDEVAFNSSIFRLNGPIFVCLFEEDGVWYCENKEFSSLTSGPTAQEPVHSFCEDFSLLWD